MLGTARDRWQRASAIAALIDSTLRELDAADVRDEIRARLCADAYRGNEVAVWALLTCHY